MTLTLESAHFFEGSDGGLRAEEKFSRRRSGSAARAFRLNSESRAGVTVAAAAAQARPRRLRGRADRTRATAPPTARRTSRPSPHPTPAAPTAHARTAPPPQSLPPLRRMAASAAPPGPAGAPGCAVGSRPAVAAAARAAGHGRGPLALRNRTVGIGSSSGSTRTTAAGASRPSAKTSSAQRPWPPAALWPPALRADASPSPRAVESTDGSDRAAAGAEKRGGAARRVAKQGAGVVRVAVPPLQSTSEESVSILAQGPLESGGAIIVPVKDASSLRLQRRASGQATRKTPLNTVPSLSTSGHSLVSTTTSTPSNITDMASGVYLLSLAGSHAGR